MNVIRHDYPCMKFYSFIFNTKLQTVYKNVFINISCKNINPANNSKGYKMRIYFKNETLLLKYKVKNNLIKKE